MNVLVWSDYLCPWCYVGQERAHHLERVHACDVVWLPYDLHPEIPDGGVEMSQRRRDAYAATFGPMAKEAGLEFNVPARVPRTTRALQAAEFVRQRHNASFDTFHAALFTAHWVHGDDISDPAVLVRLAEAAGVPAGALEPALDSGEMQDSVAASMRGAVELGVTGTPAFLLDERLLVPGVQDHLFLDRVVERLKARPA